MEWLGKQTIYKNWTLETLNFLFQISFFLCHNMSYEKSWKANWLINKNYTNIQKVKMKIYAYHKNQFLVADDTGSGEF